MKAFAYLFALASVLYLITGASSDPLGPSGNATSVDPPRPPGTSSSPNVSSSANNSTTIDSPKHTDVSRKVDSSNSTVTSNTVAPTTPAETSTAANPSNTANNSTVVTSSVSSNSSSTLNSSDSTIASSAIAFPQPAATSETVDTSHSSETPILSVTPTPTDLDNVTATTTAASWIQWTVTTTSVDTIGLGPNIVIAYVHASGITTIPPITEAFDYTSDPFGDLIPISETVFPQSTISLTGQVFATATVGWETPIGEEDAQ